MMNAWELCAILYIRCKNNWNVFEVFQYKIRTEFWISWVIEGGTRNLPYKCRRDGIETRWPYRGFIKRYVHIMGRTNEDEGHRVSGTQKKSLKRFLPRFLNRYDLYLRTRLTCVACWIKDRNHQFHENLPLKNCPSISIRHNGRLIQRAPFSWSDKWFAFALLNVCFVKVHVWVAARYWS